MSMICNLRYYLIQVYIFSQNDIRLLLELHIKDIRGSRMKCWQKIEQIE